MSVILLVVESVYGHRVLALDDEYVTMLDRAMLATNASGPAGGSLADFLLLRGSNPADRSSALNDNQSNTLLPGCPGRSLCERLYGRELAKTAHYAPYAMVRKAMVRS